MSCLESMGCYRLSETGVHTSSERAGSAHVKRGERPCDYASASPGDNSLL